MSENLDEVRYLRSRSSAFSQRPVHNGGKISVNFSAKNAHWSYKTREMAMLLTIKLTYIEVEWYFRIRRGDNDLSLQLDMPKKVFGKL